MAETIISAANRVKQWDNKAHWEYIRSNRFKKYMGNSQNSIIMLDENLTKKKGDSITLPLLGALDKSGGYNDGSTDLVGNEKALPNDGHAIPIGVVRDATVVNIEEEQASPIDIRNAGKTALKDLQMQYLRDDLINAFASVGGVNYSDATAGDKNTWTDANSDRVLFGADVANYVPGDHAASLLNIDATNDKLNKEMVSKMKRIAQSAVMTSGNGIRPYRFGEDEETFVLFAGVKAYRDLKLNLAGEHAEAEKRGKANPLFTGTTSLYWDGVVIREIPEIPDLGAVGAAGANVAPLFFCGTQALGVAWAQRTKTTLRKEDDYGFKQGVAFTELRGVNKLLWGQGASAKQWGMVSGFCAAEADA